MPAEELVEIIKNTSYTFNKVVPFNPEKDKLLLLDFTKDNSDLPPDVLHNTELFSKYINTTLQSAHATYGIGGYAEHRTIYSRSEVFNAKEGEEPRRLHLGIDIWGNAGTPLYAPLNGTIHSFAFNDAFGDYGATIILQHILEGFTFHTLYGHLSLSSIQNIKEEQEIEKGQWIATLGEPTENGYWPPHLHFQIIINMENYKGDYPGVCRYSEKEKYLSNSPDPDLLLGMMQYAV